MFNSSKTAFPSTSSRNKRVICELKFEKVPEPKTILVHVNDEKDQPILNAAIDSKVDILVTGDKHFLELDIGSLHIITPSEFKEQYIDKTSF
jgi:uncharacterized protein